MPAINLIGSNVYEIETAVGNICCWPWSGDWMLVSDDETYEGRIERKDDDLETFLTACAVASSKMKGGAK